ncbi:MAG TPA: MFS transporter [Bacillota bacterium]|nr:MFS transporter [Bacillota bacterium]
MRNKFAYASAALGDSATYCVVGTFLMFFLTTVVHIDPAVVGALIGVSALWDAVISPLIGFWSDHSCNKMGRRRPFLLAGATILAASCCLLFHTVDAGPAVKAIYYGIVIIIFWSGFSLFYIPYLALGADFTDDYTERTHLRSYAYGFNTVGTLLGIVMPSFFVDLLHSKGISVEGAWQITGALIGVVSALSIYVTFALSKNKDVCHQMKSGGGVDPQTAAQGGEKLSPGRNLMEIGKGYRDILKLKPIQYLLAASMIYLVANTICGADRMYFYTYNLGLSAASITVVLLFSSFIGISFMPVVIRLSKWFDKRSLLILMMLTSAALVLLARFIGVETIQGALAFTFVFGISSGAYWQLMPSMIYDVCEYDELETGGRREGSIVSLQSLSESISEAVAMQLLGIVLQLAGFKGEAATQSPLTLEWIENSIMVIPAIFMILSAAMVYRYPITKAKYEEIQAELADRHISL